MKKTVIITGGNKGLGADIATAFYQQGYYVVVASRYNNDFVAQLGERARFIAMDVRNPDDHKTVVKEALHWTGTLSCFINNAGFSQWCPLSKVDENFWHSMMDTNVKGTFFGCAAAAEKLSPGGCIINISSLAGKRGTANNSVYCATKFAVNGITQALAKELGAQGIRVNAVCPVFIKTDGLMEALAQPASPAQGSNIELFLKNFTETQAALKRLPSGQEVANTCLFLASEQASAITGQCLNIDCGVLPQ